MNRNLIHIIPLLVIALLASCGRQERTPDTATPTAHPDEAYSVKDRTVALIDMMHNFDSVSAAPLLTAFFNDIKGDTAALIEVTDIAGRSIGYAGSADWNEELYISFLNGLLGVDTLPSFIREREAEHLRIASLNRPGMIAADFRYIDRRGVTSTLHAIDGPLLLIFYDPECSHCSDILRWIADDRVINGAIDRGDLTVLAVYAEGKRDVWERTKGDMPSNWRVAYDLTGILDRDLYDLPAMPTLYLLDGDSRVRLKDPDYRVVSRSL